MKKALSKTATITTASTLPFLLPTCYVLPQEQCHSNGYFEGIISGGGGIVELYTSIATDQLCGFIFTGLESLISNLQ
jgi:hypothetical protein